MILIHQRYRQTDRQTDRRTTCNLNTALCTKVHRAVTIIIVAAVAAAAAEPHQFVAGQTRLIFTLTTWFNSSNVNQRRVSLFEVCSLCSLLWSDEFRLRSKLLQASSSSSSSSFICSVNTSEMTVAAKKKLHEQDVPGSYEHLRPPN